jgi:hypothetical protein
VRILDLRLRSSFAMDSQNMKTPEYAEGPKAAENFERGMIALFKVPKSAVLKAKKQPQKAANSRKSKRVDKD